MKNIIYRFVIRLKWGIKALVNTYKKIRDGITRIITKSLEWTFVVPERLFLIYGGILFLASIKILERNYNGNNEALLAGWLFIAMISGAAVIVSLAMYSEEVVRRLSKKEVIKKLEEKIEDIRIGLEKTEEKMLSEKEYEKRRREWGRELKEY